MVIISFLMTELSPPFYYSCPLNRTFHYVFNPCMVWVIVAVAICLPIYFIVVIFSDLIPLNRPLISKLITHTFRPVPQHTYTHTCSNHAYCLPILFVSVPNLHTYIIVYCTLSRLERLIYLIRTISKLCVYFCKQEMGLIGKYKHH